VCVCIYMYIHIGTHIHIQTYIYSSFVYIASTFENFCLCQWLWVPAGAVSLVPEKKKSAP
jgi:hypothetical protein